MADWRVFTVAKQVADDVAGTISLGSENIVGALQEETQEDYRVSFIADPLGLGPVELELPKASVISQSPTSSFDWGEETAPELLTVTGTQAAVFPASSAIEAVAAGAQSIEIVADVLEETEDEYKVAARVPTGRRRFPQVILKSDVVSTAPLAVLPEAAIEALFGAGEEGAWYDPSDLTTLYQDAAGTTPVTGTGQPVGLMLDKSKGGVSATELVTNGTFDSDLTGWTVGSGLSATVVAGQAEVIRTGSISATNAFQNAVDVIPGKTYLIEIEVITNNGAARCITNNSLVAYPSAGPANFVGTGTFTFIVTATDLRIRINLWSNPGETSVFDNISVRELPGNHATQSTSTARPTLQTSGGLYYLDFDGVDDFLDAPDIAGLEGISEMSVCFAATAPSGVAQQAVVSKWNVTSLSWMIDYSSTTSRFSVSTGSDGGRAIFSATRDDSVGVSVYRFAASSGYLRLNGASVSPSSDSIIATVTNANDAPVTIGAKKDGATTSAFLSGEIYGMVIRSADMTTAEIEATETYLATKSGVTLP